MPIVDEVERLVKRSTDALAQSRILLDQSAVSLSKYKVLKQGWPCSLYTSVDLQRMQLRLSDSRDC